MLHDFPKFKLKYWIVLNNTQMKAQKLFIILFLFYYCIYSIAMT